MNAKFENYKISIAEILSQFALFVYGKSFQLRNVRCKRASTSERGRNEDEDALERNNISIVIIKEKPSQRNINILIFPCFMIARRFLIFQRREAFGERNELELEHPESSSQIY